MDLAMREALKLAALNRAVRVRGSETSPPQNVAYSPDLATKLTNRLAERRRSERWVAESRQGTKEVRVRGTDVVIVGDPNQDYHFTGRSLLDKPAPQRRASLNLSEVRFRGTWTVDVRDSSGSRSFDFLPKPPPDSQRQPPAACQERPLSFPRRRPPRAAPAGGMAEEDASFKLGEKRRGRSSPQGSPGSSRDGSSTGDEKDAEEKLATPAKPPRRRERRSSLPSSFCTMPFQPSAPPGSTPAPAPPQEEAAPPPSERGLPARSPSEPLPTVAEPAAPAASPVDPLNAAPRVALPASPASPASPKAPAKRARRSKHLFPLVADAEAPAPAAEARSPAAAAAAAAPVGPAASPPPPLAAASRPAPPARPPTPELRPPPRPPSPEPRPAAGESPAAPAEDAGGASSPSPAVPEGYVEAFRAAVRRRQEALRSPRGAPGGRRGARQSPASSPLLRGGPLPFADRPRGARPRAAPQVPALSVPSRSPWGRVQVTGRDLYWWEQVQFGRHWLPGDDDRSSHWPISSAAHEVARDRMSSPPRR